MNIEGVVLAAGYSSRADAFKMTLDIGGKCVIERCIEGMLELCSRIVVVGGYGIERIEDALKNYSNVEVILNPHYAEGMFTSVKAGVRQIRGDRFFLTPGDYPLVNPATCRSLLSATGDMIIPTFGGRKGHPLLMAGDLAQELLKEPDSSSLRAFIQRKGYSPVEVADEGILWDIDTPEDYREVLKRFQRS